MLTVTLLKYTHSHLFPCAGALNMISNDQDAVDLLHSKLLQLILVYYCIVCNVTCIASTFSSMSFEKTSVSEERNVSLSSIYLGFVGSRRYT